MGETKIEWAHYTFNPWRGCTKVSAGCDHCYAETMSHRNPKVLGEWGTHGRRAMASEAYWRKPMAWNEAARDLGERRRVFCASLGDVFEDRPELLEPRARLFNLIEATPDLDWLLLTKRPENVNRLLSVISRGESTALDEMPMPNVWIGTSVEDQKTAEERVPHLLSVPAKVRFLSCEPLIGEVDLDVPRCNVCQVLRERGPLLPDNDAVVGSDGATLFCREHRYEMSYGHWLDPLNNGIHWVIVGGESGPNARPMSPAWARKIREQCLEADVPFFFKQWGAWGEGDSVELTGRAPIGWSEDDGAPRWCPSHGYVTSGCTVKCETLYKVGKRPSGRFLDGFLWNEVPDEEVE